ncbi:MAG: glycosyltransferase family 4 protein [Lentisphaerota bacterium]
MKIMLVNDVPVGLAGSGGVEKHVLELERALREAGHQTVLLTHQLRGQPEVQSAGRYLIPHFNAPPLRKRPARNYLDQSRALEKVQRIVADENPDVIHVHNFMNPRALRLLRRLRPVVKSIHDCRPFCTKPYPAVASRLIGDSETFCDITFCWRCWSRCYLRAGCTWVEKMDAWSSYPANMRALREIAAFDKVVVYSRYLGELAAACVSKEKIELVHFFTEAEKMEEAAAQPDDPPVLFFAGRLAPEKGIRHLFKAVEALPPDLRFRLVIAGDGPLREEAAAWAARRPAGGPVELAGFLSYEPMMDWYRRAYVVLFPSIGSEGCPLTGIEAMYAGAPVIGFDVGGVGEWLVNEETGVLLPRGDIAGMTRAIADLLRDPARRRAMGERARKYVGAKFRKALHLQRLSEVYEGAIRARKGGLHETG